MLALRSLPSRLSRPIRTRSCFRYLRNASSRPSPKHRSASRRRPKLSFYEELFPEEAEQSKLTSATESGDDQRVPRLRLPEVEEDNSDGDSRPKEVAGTTSAVTSKYDGPAVLVLQSASRSLVESDFRRIAPKGQHIEDWTGPGDILKGASSALRLMHIRLQLTFTPVIPSRNPETLEQQAHYFVVFPNSAYARIYQNHVLRLHRTAQTYTPTSIESPLPLQPCVLVEGEDVHSLLQDYALCPPSQYLQLSFLDPPYASRMARLLQQRGYPQLTQGKDKTGRSVLFWVDGYPQPTTGTIRSFISADGQDRGMHWDVSIEKLEPPRLPEDEPDQYHKAESAESAEVKPERRTEKRWMLSFSDENEARRFVRVWHRRAIPSARGEESLVIQAEILW